ncbi:DNA-3-methyladenine glycosylase family protein [Nigerium massiliense]|uniref:DNA-3-methyladenine glycosylase family protein n=1 Tax=Nigerium massiliense TaxID=1522317 RepID=UPI00058B83FA|nr:3-methyladenine DNA glycosylase [Nigerium massiliense]
MNAQARDWRPTWPCPVGQVWAHWRRGSGDPTYRVDDAGRHWRGLRTPCGPATLLVHERPAEGLVRAKAWGEGAAWALENLPAMLGAGDDLTGFEPRHAALAQAAHRKPHWRVGTGGCVLDALVPAIIEQKVTGQEAFSGFRRLVYRFGEPAPGPTEQVRLFVQPDAAALRRIASWDWLQLGIDGARSATVLRAARVADALDRTIGLPHDEADRRLRSLPGIGIWTSAETRCRAHGDPDAVAFGDYHVARNIGWALIGVELDDDGLAELLEPYRGHRYRVQRLLELTGQNHPRHGARMAPRTHLPVRGGRYRGSRSAARSA